MLTQLKSLFGRSRRTKDAGMISFHDCFSNVLALGVTGGGKSTSMPNVEIAFLSHESQPGAVIGCVKRSEIARAARLAELAGRREDVLICGPDTGHTLDLMQWELSRPGGSPESAAQFFDRLGAIATRNAGHGDDKIWDQYRLVMLRHAIELIRISGAAAYPPSVPPVYEIVTSPALSFQQAASESWLKGTPCGRALSTASRREQAGQLSPADQEIHSQCVSWFVETLPGLGDRFAGSVMGAAAASLLPWIFPPFKDVFASGRTTLKPDCVLEGFILIPAWPILDYGVNGAVAQAAMMQQVQQACLQREDDNSRGVAVIRDECHYLVDSSGWDAKVMTVSRSHKLAHFDYVQNVPTLQSAFGGESGDHQTESFLSAHANILLFANNCPVTNRRFSELLGTGRTKLMSFSRNPNPQATAWDSVMGEDGHVSFSVSETLYPHVPPETFGGLRKGGQANQFTVDAILYQAGRVYENGRSYRPVTFSQAPYLKKGDTRVAS